MISRTKEERRRTGGSASNALNDSHPDTSGGEENDLLCSLRAAMMGEQQPSTGEQWRARDWAKLRRTRRCGLGSEERSLKSGFCWLVLVQYLLPYTHANVGPKTLLWSSASLSTLPCQRVFSPVLIMSSSSRTRSYIVEHMESQHAILPPWVKLEYLHMLDVVAAPAPAYAPLKSGPSTAPVAQVIFSSLSTQAIDDLTSALSPASTPLKHSKSPVLLETQSVTQLMAFHGVPLERVCLLDPKATEVLSPADALEFDWFLYVCFVLRRLGLGR